MPAPTIADEFRTHEVTNQPRSMPAYNVWASDRALQEAVAREGGGWAEENLTTFGEVAGGEMMALAVQANENKPKLRSFDTYGHRIDEVEFHPAYHQLMGHAMRHGVHSFAWRNANHAGAHVARAGLHYMTCQAEQGTSCPLTMTYAAIPALQHSPEVAAEWVPRLTSTEYDPRTLPADQKTGCTIGMGMTEKQGGSDVRLNTTRATKQSDGSYEIVGHKWFFSAPMCDAHLVLAQTESGISCFLVPRILPDGTRNAVEVQRLKDKLGDWSNASSEVEFLGAKGVLVGAEGRGIRTIIEMVAMTRLDCMTSSSAQMRQALVQALNHTSQRVAFGKLLIEQPLMMNVLADLAVESEAAVALSMRVARAVDSAANDAHEAALARITTAVGKYWICKRAPAFVNEAQECLGGLGFVEDTMMPRLYRQAPLNSIWEGSGNVQCLDVLRALGKEPESRDALFAELGGVKGESAHLDRAMEKLMAAFTDPATLEVRSRMVVEQIALALQAAVLIRSGNTLIAEAFCRSRLGGEHGLAFGTLPADTDFKAIIDRAMPAT